MKKLLTILTLAAVAAAFALAPIALIGCSPAATKEAARDTYMAQHLECVDKHETRAEIDACRQRVRDAWGTVALDAGKEGGR